MLTTRVRILLVCFTSAVLSACSSSSPTTPSSRESSLVLGQGQTATAPGTDLRVSMLGNYVLGAAAAECMAGATCNFSPMTFLRVERPGVAAEQRSAHIPNPMGGESFVYGGYVVRVTGFEPAWNEKAPLEASEYKVLLTVSGQ